MEMKPVNLEEAVRALDELWSPHVVARVGDYFVKVARVRGEFVWHAHEGQDELFLVLQGRLRIQLEDGEVALGPGDVFVVPAGVRHNPVAEQECWLAHRARLDAAHRRCRHRAHPHDRGTAPLTETPLCP